MVLKLSCTVNECKPLVPGVSNVDFLRMMCNERRKSKGQEVGLRSPTVRS
jgi:hypothetical protein